MRAAIIRTDFQLVMPTMAVVTLIISPVLNVQSRTMNPIHGGRSILVRRWQSTELISPPVSTPVGNLTLLHDL